MDLDNSVFPWQIHVSDDADGLPITDVIISGFEMVSVFDMTFEYGANIGVLGTHDETGDFQVSILDCHFYGNYGFGSVVNFAFDPANPDAGSSQGMNTLVYDSHFYTNVVSGSIINVGYADMTITDVPILLNIGGSASSLVSVGAGSEVTMTNTCFQSQTASDPYASSLVYVDEFSSVTTDGSVYGRGNWFGCAGIFSDVTGTCEEFDATQCNYQLPEGLSPDCYTGDDLNSGLYLLLSDTGGYPICDGVYINSTVSVLQSDVVIYCENEDGCGFDFSDVGETENPMIAIVDNFVYGTPVTNVTLHHIDFLSFVNANGSVPVLVANSGETSMIGVMAEVSRIFTYF